MGKIFHSTSNYHLKLLFMQINFLQWIIFCVQKFIAIKQFSTMYPVTSLQKENLLGTFVQTQEH